MVFRKGIPSQNKFLIQADEFLIPKVDNANVDKSIDIFHKTILSYLKRLTEEENQINFAELKNALPFYEEHNKVNKNALSSKELKELIHAKVNKVEIYENFLNQMNKNV